jgi:hypothetical protein
MEEQHRLITQWWAKYRIEKEAADAKLERQLQMRNAQAGEQDRIKIAQRLQKCCDSYEPLMLQMTAEREVAAAAVVSKKSKGKKVARDAGTKTNASANARETDVRMQEEASNVAEVPMKKMQDHREQDFGIDTEHLAADEGDDDAGDKVGSKEHDGDHAWGAAVQTSRSRERFGFQIGSLGERFSLLGIVIFHNGGSRAAPALGLRITIRVLEE